MGWHSKYHREIIEDEEEDDAGLNDDVGLEDGVMPPEYSDDSESDMDDLDD